MAYLALTVYIAALTIATNIAVVLFWIPWAVFCIIPTTMASTISIIWLDELRLAANRESSR